jgi:hypothetical protein
MPAVLICASVMLVIKLSKTHNMQLFNGLLPKVSFVNKGIICDGAFRR